jgi:hypothetical protein
MINYKNLEQRQVLHKETNLNNVATVSPSRTLRPKSPLQQMQAPFTRLVAPSLAHLNQSSSLNITDITMGNVLRYLPATLPQSVINDIPGSVPIFSLK